MGNMSTEGMSGTTRSQSRMRGLCVVLIAVLGMLASTPAQAQIRNVGDHPKYNVELEPHLVWQWANRWWWSNSDGVGLGLRASIPLMQNGPVTTINNNLAISFGLDWAHFDTNCDYGRWNGYGCSGNDIWVPITAQWNFFLTDVVSLFPELGLAIDHSTVSWSGGPTGCVTVSGVYVCNGGSHTGVDLVLWLGARFMVAKSVGITLRLGTPSLLAGVSVLL